MNEVWNVTRVGRRRYPDISVRKFSNLIVFDFRMFLGKCVWYHD